MAETITAYTAVKLWVYACITALFAYLWIKEETFGILLILMGTDTLTWWLKALRMWNCKSSQLKWGIYNKISVLFIPLTLGYLIKWLGLDNSHFMAGIMSILILVECYSTMWNIYTMRTWDDTNPEQDQIAILIKLLMDWLRLAITKALEGVKLILKRLFKKDGDR